MGADHRPHAPFFCLSLPGAAGGGRTQGNDLVGNGCTGHRQPSFHWHRTPGPAPARCRTCPPAAEVRHPHRPGSPPAGRSRKACRSAVWLGPSDSISSKSTSACPSAEKLTRTTTIVLIASVEDAPRFHFRAIDDEMLPISPPVSGGPCGRSCPPVSGGFLDRLLARLAQQRVDGILRLGIVHRLHVQARPIPAALPPPVGRRHFGLRLRLRLRRALGPRRRPDRGRHPRLLGLVLVRLGLHHIAGIFRHRLFGRRSCTTSASAGSSLTAGSACPTSQPRSPAAPGWAR